MDPNNVKYAITPKTITIMCGLPRSGKSTWVCQHKTNDIIVSADDMRLLVYNKEYWSEGEPLMWSIREILLRMLMQQGANIIVDETNTMKERRRPIIKMAQKYGYQIICVFINSSASYKCKERAIAEGKEYLTPIIDRMNDQFEKPTKEEGFDEVIII